MAAEVYRYVPPADNRRNNRYFDAAGKRGEIHELKEELNHASKEKKKEALKKVIQAMTVGSDVSSLFPDVVNCMQTTSLDLKKLVYLYVINYAKAQPELAILAINSFRKDVNDQHNPLLRALAVRTMGCIRLEQMTEYLLEPCRKSCKDPDPYVRKTAAICIAKLYDINPELVEVNRFIDILRDMLGDQNPMVVANAVASLCEISSSSRRNYMQMNEDVIGKLLAALNECTEWGQVFILDALAMYDPPSSRVAEMILERGVMVRLSHANSAVVLSAIKVMMKFMDRIQSPETVRALCKKMTPPLVTLLSAEPEIQYVVMRNINLIVQKQNQILQSDVRMFVCKYNDPLYVKLEKISVMVQLASERNIDQVLSEFREYASEVDIDCVRKSVRAVGQCAIKLDRAAERCVDCLLDLIKTKVNYVVQEAIVVIRDIFRKYPGRYEIIISDLCENLDSLDEPDAKAAMIWIIGEYAERIDNSVDLLESFLENFHEEPSSVQLQLLTATVKLCLKVGNQARELVGRVVKVATDECTNPDLRDRGYMYWRLLTTNAELAKHVVLSERPTISDDSFATQPRILERLIANISTLSSVYHQEPEKFIVATKAATDEEDSDEDEDDEEDSQEKLTRLQNEMRRGKAYEEASDDGHSEGGGSSGSSSGSDAGRSGNSAPPPALRQMTEVLNESQPGNGGNRGLKVSANVVRGPGGKVGMQLKVGNFSPQPMSGWSIRFNKNSFGFAPAADVQLPELAPNGGNANTMLQIVPNSLNSGTPPSMPLYLEVAVKTNLDIFYFSVGYDLSAVLAADGPVGQDVFRDIWGRVPQEQKARTVGNLTSRVSPQQIAGRMKQYFCYMVAQREDASGAYMFFSAMTINRLEVYMELGLQRDGTGVQLVACSKAPPLVPLVQAYVSEVLRVRWG